MPPATKSHQLAEPFSLTGFVRSLLKDSDLRPGEGRLEADAVARAGQELSRNSGATMRGHVLPTRAESGGLSTGTLAGGGAMVGSGLSLAQALQPVLQIERLGANRVNLDYGDNLVSVPAIAGGGWVCENGEIDCSEALFASAMRNPKEAAARLRLSRRLFIKQSGISEREFRSLLQRTISSTIEAGLLNGTGAEGQPLGILNDQQLQQESFTSTTALPTREKVAELVAAILTAGGDLEAVQILLSAADYESSQHMVDPTAGTSTLVEITNGQRRLAGIPVAFSPYVPTGKLIVADWSRVSVGYVGQPQLIVNPYTYAESATLELTTFQAVSIAVERRNLLTIATLTA